MFRSDEHSCPIGIAIAAYFLVCVTGLFSQASRGCADPETCAGCDGAIAWQYARTGMAQSFGSIHSNTAPHHLNDGAFNHAAPAEIISVASGDGSVRMERHQSGFDEPIAVPAGIEPNFATARYNLAVVLESQENSPKAGQELLAAVRPDPGYYAAHLKLAEVLLTTHMPSEALPHLRLAAGSPDKNLSERATALTKLVAP